MVVLVSSVSMFVYSLEHGIMVSLYVAVIEYAVYLWHP